MAHLDAYLQKCPAFGWEGDSAWYTQEVGLANKRFNRNGEWSQPLVAFSLTFNNNFPEAYEQASDLHDVCRGKLNAFRARNHLRYKATNQLFGYGNGAADEFQLGRLIALAGESVKREIYALSLDPLAPTPSVTVNGSPASATFDNRTGKVVFDTPPALDAELRWTGWWDHWVRFAVDNLKAALVSRSGDEDVITYQIDLVETEAPDEGFST